MTTGMDLTAISAFVAVGENGGFRAAAATLGITSAAVSKAVARLEAQLGVLLVARTTRSVRLTASGALFHARCKAILADLDAASRAASDGATLPQGRLVISASRTFGRLHVLPAAADFTLRHPQVETEVRLGDRVVDLVSEGVDLAFRVGDLPNSSLVATRIASTGFVLCGAPAYLAANGMPRHPDDLRSHMVVGYVVPGTANRFTYRFLVDGVVREVTPPARLTTDDGEALVVAGVRGAGLVMVNDYLVESMLADGTLVRLLAEYELPRIPISAVHLPSRMGSPGTRAFTAMLRARLATMRHP